MEKKVLAFDFGASGGRAMCGTFDGDKISIEELHRFSNDPVILNGSMYWDVLRLFFEIKQGLIKAKKCGKIESIGIDTWGVDFGLIDEEGRLLENPVHYRDARTEGMIEESFKLIDKEKFYQITGKQSNYKYRCNICAGSRNCCARTGGTSVYTVFKCDGWKYT